MLVIGNSILQSCKDFNSSISGMDIPNQKGAMTKREREREHLRSASGGVL